MNLKTDIPQPRAESVYLLFNRLHDLRAVNVILVLCSQLAVAGDVEGLSNALQVCQGHLRHFLDAELAALDLGQLVVNSRDVCSKSSAESEASIQEGRGESTMDNFREWSSCHQLRDRMYTERTDLPVDCGRQARI